MVKNHISSGNKHRDAKARLARKEARERDIAQSLVAHNKEEQPAGTSVSMAERVYRVKVVENSSNPIGLFSLFFDDEVIDFIVRETNLYVQQCLAETMKTWSTNAEEIRAYIGVNILMGIVHLPEIRDYWAKDEKLHYSPIASRMSRSRFEDIVRYLHFADNSSLPSRGEEGYYRLQKVQPIITAMKQRCTSLYQPNAQNSIDEAMIPFKGTCTTQSYYQATIHFLTTWGRVSGQGYVPHT